MTETPDDIARLMHEALETVGWDADASEVAKQVERLDIGLPAEDEFAVVCSWLGKCCLIHKLDQHQMPRKSSEAYQVPDLIARFKTQSNDRPVLIEVKCKTSNTLSMRPDYLQRLQNYADLMGMPLLFAWKFHSVWILFEAKHFKKATKNLNISFNTAMRENLLGVLAGDFGYRIGVGAGVHLRCDKEELISSDNDDNGKQDLWQTTIGAVAFTGRNGENIPSPSRETQHLFFICDLEEKTQDNPGYISVSYIAPEEGLQFAHSSLVRLLDPLQRNKEKRSWRRVARQERFTDIEDFRSVVLKAMDEKVVNIVLDVRPQTMPDFVSPLPQRA